MSTTTLLGDLSDSSPTINLITKDAVPRPRKPTDPVCILSHVSFLFFDTLISLISASSSVYDANAKPHVTMADTIADNDTGLNEPSYDVQVTLADLQDTDNPLATAKDFKDLNLWVDLV